MTLVFHFDCNGNCSRFCFEYKFPLFISHLALRLACLFASMWACFSARTDPSPVAFAFLLLIYWLLRSERCHFLSVRPTHRLQPTAIIFNSSIRVLLVHALPAPSVFPSLAALLLANFISSCDSLCAAFPPQFSSFSLLTFFSPILLPRRSPSERLRIPKGADAIKMLILSVYRERYGGGGADSMRELRLTWRTRLKWRTEDGGRWLGAQRERRRGMTGSVPSQRRREGWANQREVQRKRTDEARAKAADTAVMDCFSSNAQKMAALMCCFQQRTQYLRLRITTLYRTCAWLSMRVEPSRSLWIFHTSRCLFPLGPIARFPSQTGNSFAARRGVRLRRSFINLMEGY